MFRIIGAVESIILAQNQINPWIAKIQFVWPI